MYNVVFLELFSQWLHAILSVIALLLELVDLGLSLMYFLTPNGWMKLGFSYRNEGSSSIVWSDLEKNTG